MSNHEFSDIDDVKAIIEIAQEHDLDGLIIKDGDWELCVTRREAQAAPAATIPVVAQELPPAPTMLIPTVVGAPPPAAGNDVVAPIIGVFYRAPSPSSPVFVNVGDRVAVGQTLCILEAMKLMNEITSDYAGVISSINVENGALVTIGQSLFTISPHA